MHGDSAKGLIQDLARQRGPTETYEQQVGQWIDDVLELLSGAAVSSESLQGLFPLVSASQPGTSSATSAD